MRVKQRVHIKTIAMSMLVVTGALMFHAVSSAQANDTTTAPNTIRVSPLRTDVTADPGETKIVKVTVTNPADQEVAVRPVQNDFTSNDEQGTPALFLEEDQYAPKRSLKRLMQPLEDVTLAAGESKTIDVTIIVPTDAAAGGYFGAIRFTPTATADGGQVNMSASVASLILLRVTGDAAERLNLTELAVQQAGVTGGFFTHGNNLAVTARFENVGDVQLAPFGKVSVQKGNTVVHEADFNVKNPRDMVLPDGARRWNIPLKDIEGFGKYTVSATFTYGSSNQTIEVVSSFWVVPWTIIIGGIVLLVLIIGLIVLTVMRIRRRGRKVSLGL